MIIKDYEVLSPDMCSGGTSLQGYKRTTYDRLVEVLGKPTFTSADPYDKVNCEWVHHPAERGGLRPPRGTQLMTSKKSWNLVSEVWSPEPHKEALYLEVSSPYSSSLSLPHLR